jgi:hypothetical protein
MIMRTIHIAKISFLNCCAGTGSVYVWQVQTRGADKSSTQFLLAQNVAARSENTRSFLVGTVN